MIHPARQLPFDQLHWDLEYAVQEGMAYKHTGKDGLMLYCYSDKTVYDRHWTATTILARGVVLDIVNECVVATPFPKFFNIGETDQITIPDLPFETFEKLDGSLIIIFYHNGKWKTATKGSLSSEQAKWAQKWLEFWEQEQPEYFKRLEVGVTYLAECIYPENRIVVDYGSKRGLVILAGYRATGEEYSYSELKELFLIEGNFNPFEVVERYSYGHISELLEKAKILKGGAEGWVIRFSDGTRVKIKGEEYCRIHRLVAGLTPLSVWRIMRDEASGMQLDITRRSLPEEFWEDFDTIVMLLTAHRDGLIKGIMEWCDRVSELTDKEVGLKLAEGEFPEDVAKFIFPCRKAVLLEGRGRIGLYEAIRPDRNVLEGYRASSAMSRVQENE